MHVLHDNVWGLLASRSVMVCESRHIGGEYKVASPFVAIHENYIGLLCLYVFALDTLVIIAVQSPLSGHRAIVN